MNCNLYKKHVGQFEVRIDRTIDPHSGNERKEAFRFQVNASNEFFTHQNHEVLKIYDKHFVAPIVRLNTEAFAWWVMSFGMVMIYCSTIEDALNFYDNAETHILQAKLMI
jgi:hypothetical protein